MDKETEIKDIQDEIIKLVEEFTNLKHKDLEFIPGVSRVPVNGRVFDSLEVKSLIEASLDFWLTDGEYYGSWSHYPYFDIKKNLDEINSYDGIYISHIHPDHCSDKTLSLIKKNIPIFIHKFHAPFLKAKLERFGFKVIEIENGKTLNLKKNLNITIYAADNCNPELCYKFTGCANILEKKGSQQIDTMAVIDDNQNFILNTNDCPYDLSKEVLERIKSDFNKINVLLTFLFRRSCSLP